MNEVDAQVLAAVRKSKFVSSYQSIACRRVVVSYQRVVVAYCKIPPSATQRGSFANEPCRRAALQCDQEQLGRVARGHCDRVHSRESQAKHGAHLRGNRRSSGAFACIIPLRLRSALTRLRARLALCAQVVLDSPLTSDLLYQKPSDSFVQWKAGVNIHGERLRRGRLFGFVCSLALRRCCFPRFLTQLIVDDSRRLARTHGTLARSLARTAPLALRQA